MPSYILIIAIDMTISIFTDPLKTIIEYPMIKIEKQKKKIIISIFKMYLS